MKLLPLLALLSIFVGFSASADDVMPVYKVTDVLVDVTSGNASLARDLAIVQAQKQAFVQLMDRLGVRAPVNLGSDDVGAFVQSFEVQKEHASGVRYLATFSVQFKPDVVRNYLSQKGIAFVEARPKPMVVLPILHGKDHDVLWEDTTAWQEAWANVAKKAGLVPVIVPPAELDNIATISAAEALSGASANLQALMRKYEAYGVIVAVLNADLELTAGRSPAEIDVFQYDFKADPLPPFHITLPTLMSAKTLEDELEKGVYQVIGQVERFWRETNKAPEGPSLYLPVDVAVPTLAAWSQIRNRLKNVTAIASSHVVTMTRGLVHAEIEYRGSMQDLQPALLEQGLVLDQDITGSWRLGVANETQNEARP